MSRLWSEEEGRQSHVLRAETLEDLGGAEEIVRRHLDDAMSALGPEERDVAARMLHQLVDAVGGADRPQGRRPRRLRRRVAGGRRADSRAARRASDPSHDRPGAGGEDAPFRDQARRAGRRRGRVGPSIRGAQATGGGRGTAARGSREAAAAAADAEAGRPRHRARVPDPGPDRRVVRLERQERRQGTARHGPVGGRHAGRGRAAQSADPVESVRAGYKAFALPHAVPAAEEVLRSALVAAHRRGVFIGHKGNVTKALFSPDGSRVATASADGTARLWDPVTGTVARQARSRRSRTAARSGQRHRLQPERAAARDGRRRRSGPAMGRSGRSPARGASRPCKGLNSVAFSRSGRLLITASDDGTARIWRTDNPDHALVRVLRGQAGPVAGASFSPSGTQAVTASADHAALLWNLAQPKRPPVRLPAGSGRVVTASFSPDGRRLVTAGDDAVVRIWNTRTGGLVAARKGHRRPRPRRRVQPDRSRGRHGRSRRHGASLAVRRRARGNPRDPGRRAGQRGVLHPGRCVRRHRRAGHGTHRRTAGASLVATLRRPQLAPIPSTRPRSAPTRAWSSPPAPTGRPGSADAETGKPARSLRTGRGAVSGLAVGHDSDGALVALGGAGKPGAGLEARPGRARSGTPPAGSVTSIAISPDGRLVAVTSSDGATASST